MEQFVFFGGKGGVGKTTVSCAYALKCAEAGLDTLVVSTDPAHSTADVFDQAFDDDPTAVEGRERLWAMEIDPDEEVERHMGEIRRRMNEQVSAAIVNEIDRQIELAHRTPGAYEAALFDRFIEVMRTADDYDRVVFDTSPTGGTLRLLALPDFLEGWIERLVAKRTKSVDLFEKAAVGDREARRKLDEDPLIAHLQGRKERFEFAGRTLRDESAFFLVVNPDELSIRETERAVAEMAEQDLGVEGLVVNRVTPAPDEDEQGRGATWLRDRVATERERIDEIRRAFDEPVVAEIESRVREVKGDLLAAVADELAIDADAGSVEA
ncbi:transport ATPase (substrate arsenite) [Halosimplex carlsbadense 2-9-1]|uniref:Transport ATPase (Substrate arsenite) n=1 Tax=Halosimplex carlsbadense 2-9-1 TaxID=797114 RepID=M0D413_9EURY|nr:TRC40/GET3/ArsA family transport-energizing ATPase [Halosimplex carlsbadense]ELZ30271.1 transport ATPase (substrate arsenite) [Halosimplex carlsbadense 2-9-1]